MYHPKWVGNQHSNKIATNIATNIATRKTVSAHANNVVVVIFNHLYVIERFHVAALGTRVLRCVDKCRQPTQYYPVEHVGAHENM